MTEATQKLCERLGKKKEQLHTQTLIGKEIKKQTKSGNVFMVNYLQTLKRKIERINDDIYKKI